MKNEIHHIEWISKEALEAIVTITDGQHQCYAFCQPCHYQEDDIIVQPLYALNITDFMRLTQEGKTSLVQHKNDSQFFCHDIIGILKIGKNNIVTVGDIQIELLDTIPVDIINESLVSFTVSRLDLI